MKDAAAIVPCAPCVKTKRRKMSHIFSCFYEKKVLVEPAGAVVQQGSSLSDHVCKYYMSWGKEEISVDSLHTQNAQPPEEIDRMALTS